MLVLVLTLDTSTPAVTAGVVRLLRPHDLVAELEAGRPAGPVVVESEHVTVDAFAHAELLMPQARRALADAGRAMADLDAVVVGLGPGPFTGLRVGMVTAAALGDALDLPVHGVPSHDAVAWSVAPPGRPVGTDFLVVTDARRREVYLSGYTAEGRRVRGPEVLRPGALDAAELAGWAITGAGAHLLDDLGLPPIQPAIQPTIQPPLTGGSAVPTAPNSLHSHQSARALPVSAGLAGRAAPALLTGVVPGPLTPLYLRRPDAVPPRPRQVLAP